MRNHEFSDLFMRLRRRISKMVLPAPSIGNENGSEECYFVLFRLLWEKKCRRDGEESE